MIPEKIGRYQIKEQLGRGGMSVVYRAYDPLFERDVTLKLMSVDLLGQPDFHTRFLQEAKTIAALDHPAIVPVYDLGEEAGRPYFVMRYMTAGSLAEKLTDGPLSLADAARILTRLAPALDEAHAQGIIHRDLKPSNVLFDQWQEAYIADFGIAKLSESTQHLTQTGAIVGTPAYMSPEQIQGDVVLDGRSDIYTLGIMLFEMLTGSHPYETDTPIAVAVKHISAPVPRLIDIAPDLPADCQAVLDKAMAKDRAARYPTAVSLAEAVEALVAPPAVTQPTQPLTQTGRYTAVSRYIWLLPVAVVSLLLLALLVNNSSPFSPEQPPLSEIAEPAAAVDTPASPTNRPTQTATARPSHTPTTLPTLAVTDITPSPTPTLTPTPTATPTVTPVGATTVTTTVTTTAVAQEGASLFSHPDAQSTEITIVSPGDSVSIIGRAPEGQWLYVLSEDWWLGYAFAPRFEWHGRFEDLPIIEPDS